SLNGSSKKHATRAPRGARPHRRGLYETRGLTALWPVIPRKVPVDGHVVSVGWFTSEQDPHKLLLLSYTVGRWDLLVIPPQTDPAIAAWLMTAATGPLLSHTASDLLERAKFQRNVTEADQAREGVWDSEGGHGARVTAPARSA
ncbi:DUF5994 family protein, partial [Streptomyces sp. NPDC005480]|uniref:DUF5994 family protein n=1 Tax=Streptomyces sp. NPDC005480 TaxID=3154880 RepID=UPI0033A270B9